jgi:hypothetical protein
MAAERAPSIYAGSGSLVAMTDHVVEHRFRCPLCSAEQYRSVMVERPGQQPFVLPLFACNGCTVVFTDPWLFTRQHHAGYQVAPQAREIIDPRQR